MTPFTRPARWRSVAALAGLTTAAVLAVAVAPVHAPVAQADAAGQGGDFVPFATPGRLLDTRNGTGGITGKLAQRSTNSFPVLGHAGVPSTNVRAVLLNVATVNPSTRLDLTLWPNGAARPSVSMVNALAGQTISNTAVVAPGSDGRIAIFNGGGSTDAVVDVEGYFTVVSAGGNGGFVPVAQTRLLDTRSGIGAPAAAILPGGVLTANLAVAPVPSGATALFVDVMVPGASVGGYVSAFPAGGTDGGPVINFINGNTAQGASIPLGANGDVSFANYSAHGVNLVIDVEGYFVLSATEGAGLATSRLLDTRTTGIPIPANGTIDLSVGGRNGLPTRGIAGAVLNFTSVNQTASQGFLRVWPKGDAEPST